MTSSSIFVNVAADADIIGESIGENYFRVKHSDFPKLYNHYPTGFFVKFMVPWSEQCKKWGPVFKEAAHKVNLHPRLKELGYMVPFVEVDMTDTTNLPLSQKYDISGFPTFLFMEKHHHDRGDIKPDEDVKDGKTSFEEFEGDMATDAIVDFIESMSGPAMQEKPASESEKLAITLYSPDRVAGFEKIARKTRRLAHFHHMSTGDGDYRVEVKHIGETPFILQLTDKATTTESQIMEFIKRHKIPRYGIIDRTTFGHYAGHPIVWVLPQHGENDFAEASTKYRDYFMKAAGDNDYYKIAAANTINFRGQLQSMFGISEFPYVVVQKRAGSQVYYNFEDDIEKVMESDKEGNVMREWLKKIENDSIERSYKSEPVPDYEPEPGEPAIIVAKNMKEKIFDPELDVFINIFAPWCGHCKNFAPEFRKIARKVYESGYGNKIRVATLDGTANESTDDRLSWDAFPTVALVKKGTDELVRYEGPRDAGTVYEWLSTHSSFGGEMDKEIGEVKMDL